MVKVAEMGSAVAALPNSAERLRQRYDNHLRLVAGCVPYKLKPNTEEGAHDNLEDRLQVLMVSSPNRDDLVFPKGGWENGETEREAACREAFEEAGIKGTIHGTLGVWEFRSKSSQKNCSLEGSCRGSMFAFEVTDELTSWPEEAIHQRRWLKVEDAFRLCRYDWMREALSHCLIFLSSEHPSSPVPEVKEASVPANSKRVESPILYVDSSCQLVHNSSGFGTTVYK